MATVHEYRLKAGLSKSALCKRADVDFQTLTRAENGDPVQEHNAQKIVNALNAVLDKNIEIKDVEGLNIYRP